MFHVIVIDLHVVFFNRLSLFLSFFSRSYLRAQYLCILLCQVCYSGGYCEFEFTEILRLCNDADEHVDCFFSVAVQTLILHTFVYDMFVTCER